MGNAAAPIVVERRYRPTHPIGHLRFLECGALDAALGDIRRDGLEANCLQPGLHDPLDPEYSILKQRLARRIVIAEPVQDYVIRLILATHPGGEFADPNAAREISVGASPRAAQAIVTAAKVRALLDGRFHVSIGDVHAVAAPALRHRIAPSFEAEADGLDADRIVAGIVARLPRALPEAAP